MGGVGQDVGKQVGRGKGHHLDGIVGNFTFSS